MATIREVAKLTGVSVSTVSRALANRHYVKEETRERILQAVRELDYRPNLMARGLKEGCTKTLALVLPDITNPFYPKLVKSVEKYADANGYSIILFDSNEDKKRELHHIETLLSHAVDGVLFISSSDDTAQLNALRDAGLPMVIVNRDFECDYLRISNDNYDGAYAMIDYLIKNGHRRIACLLGSMKLQRYRQRCEGCRQAMADNGIENFDKLFFHDVTTTEKAYAMTKSALAMRERPTAFFAFIDMIAMGVYSAVNDSGFRIPDDISVVGFDNIHMSQHMVPPLTTYEHPVDEIAKTAIESLIRQMKTPGEKLAGMEIIKGSLIVRKSVGKASP